MAISRLEIHRLRNLWRVDIRPGEGINYIVGANGSGKTSLLEAIYCLGRGRSFRTNQTNHLIAHDADDFTVVGRFLDDHRKTVIGVQRSRAGSVIRIDGVNVVSAAQLASRFPVLMTGPGVKGLFDDGPEPRRRFLDWGVFHVEPEFRAAWNRYRRVLCQRNAALRQRCGAQALSGWDRELVQYADVITTCRERYLTRLVSFLDSAENTISGSALLSLRLYRGWGQSESYADFLARNYPSDLQRGFTQYGPHRADLRFYVDSGKEAKNVVSRGQQKSWVAELIVAQCRHLVSEGILPTLLVDDLPAELDPEKRSRLIQSLFSIGIQVFVTATERALFSLDDLSLGQVFHVEQGGVSPMV